MSANLRAKAFFDRAFLAVGEPSWLLLCFIVVVMALGNIARLLPDVSSYLQTSMGQLLSGVVVYVLTGVLVVLPLWYLRSQEAVRNTLGVVKWPRMRDLGLAVPMWVLYMLATIIVGVAVAYLVPWIDTKQVQNVGFKDIDTPMEYVIAFVALVVLPPIAEELLFRGYLFGRLRTRLDFKVSALIVSIVFGLVHQQWNVAIDTFILSIFLCYLRESTGSIWASMVLHGLKNAVAYMLLFIAPLMGWGLLQ